MAAVYIAMTATSDMSAPAISKMLTRHGIHTKSTSNNGKKGRYFTVRFNSPALDKNEIKVLTRTVPGANITDLLQEKKA